MKTRNAGYNSTQNLQSFGLLSKNIKIKVNRTIILPAVLYGRDTWSLTLRAEHRLRVFEKTVLRKIFGSKRDEVTGECEDCMMRSFMTFTVHHTCTLLGPSNRGDWGGGGGGGNTGHVGKTGKVHTGLWWTQGTTWKS
jgi:hypothetical protein